MALKKVLNPTYKFPVEIPVPGGKPEKINITYKYKTESQLKQYLEENADKLVIDFLCEFIADWDQEESFGEFSEEALKDLADVYPGAINAIHMGFYKSRTQGRVGN